MGELWSGRFPRHINIISRYLYLVFGRGDGESDLNDLRPHWFSLHLFGVQNILKFATAAAFGQCITIAGTATSSPLRLRLHSKAAHAAGVKSQSRITMGRRYRRRNSLGSVVVDIVRIASRLPWWGALLVGLMGYLAIYVGLGGYLEGQ